jgi:hypothetical protein
MIGFHIIAKENWTKNLLDLSDDDFGLIILDKNRNCSDNSIYIFHQSKEHKILGYYLAELDFFRLVPLLPPLLGSAFLEAVQHGRPWPRTSILTPCWGSGCDPPRFGLGQQSAEIEWLKKAGEAASGLRATEIRKLVDPLDQTFTIE